VLAPGNFDAGSDHNTTEGAPAAVGMIIPPGYRANIEEDPNATPTLDPQSGACQVGAPDTVGAERRLRAAG
jgi:hypothetical protein